MNREIFLRVKRDFDGFKPIKEISDKSWLIAQLLWNLWDATIKFGRMFSETEVGWKALDLEVSAEADWEEGCIYFDVQSEYSQENGTFLFAVLSNGLILTWDRVINPSEVTLALESLDEKGHKLDLFKKGRRVPCQDPMGVDFQNIPRISRRMSPPVDFTGREFVDSRYFDEQDSPETIWYS